MSDRLSRAISYDQRKFYETCVYHEIGQIAVPPQRSKTKEVSPTLALSGSTSSSGPSSYQADTQREFAQVIHIVTLAIGGNNDHVVACGQ